MGRKKKDAAEPQSAESTADVQELEMGVIDPSRVDFIAAEHMKIKRRLASLKAKRDFFRSNEGDEVVGSLIRDLEQQVADLKEENVTPGTKSAVRVFNDGKVSAFREVRSRLKGLHWDWEIDQVSKQLADFEEANALFIAAAVEPVNAFLVVAAGELEKADRERLIAFGLQDAGNGNFIGFMDNARALEFARNLDPDQYQLMEDEVVSGSSQSEQPDLVEQADELGEAAEA